MRSERPQVYGDRERPVEITCSMIDGAKGAFVGNVKMKILTISFSDNPSNTLLSKQMFSPQLLHQWYKAAIVWLWQEIKIVKVFQSRFLTIKILKRGCKTQKD